MDDCSRKSEELIEEIQALAGYMDGGERDQGEPESTEKTSAEKNRLNNICN